MYCPRRFEQSGHLNKIRAHICQHAITTLRDMPAQIKTNGNNAATIKIQAINLLVADFLMNQDNLFTLKVLITEVGISLGNAKYCIYFVFQFTFSFRYRCWVIYAKYLHTSISPILLFKTNQLSSLDFV